MMQDREQIEQMLEGFEDDSEVVLLLLVNHRTDHGTETDVRSVHESVDGLLEFAHNELMRSTRAHASVRAHVLRE